MNGDRDMCIHTKTFEDLTLSDDFLFSKVMRNPELRKETIVKLLEIKDIKRIY